MVEIIVKSDIEETPGTVGELNCLFGAITCLVDKGVISPTDLSKKICGEWTIKEVLAHLSRWNNITLETLDGLNTGEFPEMIDNIDVFNAEGVTMRQDWTWEAVYDEFNKSTSAIVQRYWGMPDELWDRRFWQEEDLTPRIALSEDVKHYQEHFDQILGLLTK